MAPFGYNYLSYLDWCWILLVRRYIMSMHKQDDVNGLREELIKHGLDPDKPSLSSDCFRLGWRAYENKSLKVADYTKPWTPNA